MLVSLRDNEILMGYLHLLMGSRGLSRTDVKLPQEVVEWSDQILNEVEVVVVHLVRDNNRARTPTVLVQGCGV